VVSLPPAKLALVTSRQTLFDGRRVLQALRETALQPVHLGPLRPPVDGVAGQGFGSLTTYAGADRPVEQLEDALFGEQHHGLDYEVPVGTAVRAPGAGRVLLATWLAGTGWTVLVDHGEGVVSGLLHLSALAVRAGDDVEAGAVVGRSGEHGVVPGPLVQWNAYVHGVAVDPEILMRGFGD
jgi:murein DD-endopeptidase MepM/ murein hydrolase activator NlpD